jgi:hypothetical protein
MCYLIVSAGGRTRFRSVLEFIPHAIWLFSEKSTPCECKHCSKRPQRDIADDFASRGIISQPTAASSSKRPRPSIPPPALPRTKKRRLPEPPQWPVAENFVQIITYHPDLPRLIFNTRPEIPERGKELRSAKTHHFRLGELVWCMLASPIYPTKGLKPGAEIKFWPGLIDDINLRTRPDADPMQEHIFSVKLLALPHRAAFRSGDILPYQASRTTQALTDNLRALPPTQLEYNRDEFRKFDCVADNSAKRPPFVRALSALALALEIAKEIQERWTLTDQFSIQYHTLPPLPTTTSISAPTRLRSSPTVTQNHFLGMWWGPERIWMGDLVRVKMGRDAFAPDGVPHVVFPPSGPGEATKTTCEVPTGADMGELGARSRGLFIRVDRIFIQNMPTASEDGHPVKECRIAGMVYELADDDWNEHPESFEVERKRAAAQPDYIPLPEPPIGFQFRPILAHGCECVMSLAALAGRYYPRILLHPLLENQVLSLVTPTEAVVPDDYEHLVCLEGLDEGLRNAVEALHYRKSRIAILQEADRVAVKNTETFRMGKAAMAREGSTSSGEVEILGENELDSD